MSFMADSSDYKQSNSDFGDGDKTATSEAPLRGEVDMVRIYLIYLQLYVLSFYIDISHLMTPLDVGCSSSN